MATPTQAIQRIRRARRNAAPSGTKDFETYRPVYKEILTGMRNLGGDAAIDEVTKWMVAQVQTTGHLPEPSAVRANARDVATARDLTIPEGSPLERDLADPVVSHGDSSDSSGEVSGPDDVFDRMVPFEPYTDEQLAKDLEIQKQQARDYLKRLEEREKIHRKKPAGSRTLWIREPKAQTCPNCGRAFEVKYVHVIFSSSRVCPRCGTRL